MNVRRLTDKDLAQIAASLSERDLKIVSTVSKLRLVSFHQIRRLHFVSGTASSNARLARLVLAKLVGLRVLYRLERRIGGARAGSNGFVYGLDAVGHYVAGIALDVRRRKPDEPGLAFVNHRLTISEFYVRLVEAERVGQLELLEFVPEPGCWRSFFGTGGARVMLKPDAFVRTASGKFEQLRFIEIDLGTEGSAAIRNKFRLYRQYWASGKEQARWGDVFPKVLFLTPSLPRLRRLIDIAGSQPPESWKLFSVRPYDDGLSAFVSEEEAA